MPAEPARSRRGRTAFVLSGGASLGAVQVGMLEALAERGIVPDLVVGTSAGAINAAWLAGAPDPPPLERLAALWTSLHFADVFPFSPGALLGSVIGRSNHLFDSSGLERLIREHIDFQNLEDAPRPLHVIATEVLTGRMHVLSRGPAVPALLASCAIPGAFPPVQVGGVDLIDGGVSANAPITQAVALGATTVYVLPTGYACALASPPPTVIGMALHSLSILLEQQLISDVARNQGSAEIHVMPPLCPLSVSPADFGHAAQLIARAHSATRSWLRRAPRVADQAGLLAFHGPHRHAAARRDGT